MKTVHLYVDLSTRYGEGVVRGVIDRQPSRGPWRCLVKGLHFDPDQAGGVPEPDGVIFQDLWPNLPEELATSGVPRVGVSEVHGADDQPIVTTDHRKVADLLVDHFLERGFKQFAFVGFEGHRISAQRERSVRERLLEAQLPLVSYRIAGNGQVLGRTDRLCDWVASLPKPIAVLACNDLAGMRTIQACEQAQVMVPQQVAVAGVDDEPFCELFKPTLTSVRTHAYQIGQTAAELLHRQMDGQDAATASQWVAPAGLVARDSSDVLAIADAQVARAVNFIAHHAHTPIRVDHVVREAGTSRRTLEARFRRVLDRTIHGEIQRVRMRRAQHLLQSPDQSIGQVAQQCGFRSAAHFTHAFREHFGLTPRDYRQSQHQR